MNRIIIDADPGVDDIFALLLAIRSAEIQIEAITVVSGNCDLENATNNTLKILDMENQYNIPVYKGMDKALKAKNKNASHVHGNNGMGGVCYEPSTLQAKKIHAVDFLIEKVKNNPGQITIVAIGPLTNIACAINKDKDFASNVKRIIVMGGAMKEGNITPSAEFNFYKDPDAAEVVSNANFKQIIMIGLDVTTKLPLNEKIECLLQNINNDLSNFLFKITRTGADFDRKLGFDGLILNDPLTIAYLLDPSIIELKNIEVDIETDGELIGKSNISFTGKSNCLVACDVNSDKFYKLLFERIFNIQI